MGGERSFTREELDWMAKPTREKAKEALDAGSPEEAKQYCDIMYRELLWIHDGYRNWITALLSYIGRKFGDETLEDALRETCSTWQKPLYEKSKQTDLKKRIQLMARMWHSHAFPFRIDEDDEKFVFTNMPCGSGGRLINEGFYEKPSNFLKVEKAQPMTYGKEKFPVYCTHCAVAEEMLTIEWGGYPAVVTLPPEKPGDSCVHYVYKDPYNIPDEYYRRVGKEKK